jgi:RNA polymerase sigma-70 factor (ECF subfamily)
MTGNQDSGLASPATSNEREAIYRTWMERHAAAVARAVAVYERDPSERQDLVQEIWIAIWKSLPSFRGESSERTFIFRIVHNRSVSHVDRRVRDRGITGDVPDVHDELADPLQRVSANEEFERLLGMIHQLPMMDRQLLQLSLEGMKQREIGDVLGISENNVAVRLNRAREKLRKLLEERQ